MGGKGEGQLGTVPTRPFVNDAEGDHSLRLGDQGGRGGGLGTL